jgi:hypothetical protein
MKATDEMVTVELDALGCARDSTTWPDGLATKVRAALDAALAVLPPQPGAEIVASMQGQIDTLHAACEAWAKDYDQRGELMLAIKTERDALLRDQPPTPTLPVEEPPGHVRVRVACAVQPDRDWHAAGDAQFDDRTAIDEACFTVSRTSRIYWLQADLALPLSPPVVAAVVEEPK